MAEHETSPSNDGYFPRTSRASGPTSWTLVITDPISTRTRVQVDPPCCFPPCRGPPRVAKRGFSWMNRVHTETRNRLALQTVAKVSAGFIFERWWECGQPNQGAGGVETPIKASGLYLGSPLRSSRKARELPRGGGLEQGRKCRAEAKERL